jgi:hypothetical protein
VPKGSWYTLCEYCNLAESAHSQSTNPPFHYVGDDVEETDG